MFDLLLPDAIPESWIEQVEFDIRAEVPATFPEPPLDLDRVDAATESTIEQVRHAYFPAFGLEP